MKIGGFQKMSLIDYPGKVSSIVFTVGCNMRCKFCHVPQLVDEGMSNELKLVPEEEVFSYLKKNRELIDAVVITGGEPTLQADLHEFVTKVKGMGFLVALETNGTMFDVLRGLVDGRLVDYVAMDIKSKLELQNYRDVAVNVTEGMFENVKKSVKLLMDSNTDYEFRTTVMKELHSRESLAEIAGSISGARNYYIQNFKDNANLTSTKFTQFSDEEMDMIVNELKVHVNAIKR